MSESKRLSDFQNHFDYYKLTEQVSQYREQIRAVEARLYDVTHHREHELREEITGLTAKIGTSELDFQHDYSFIETQPFEESQFYLSYDYPQLVPLGLIPNNVFSFLNRFAVCAVVFVIPYTFLAIALSSHYQFAFYNYLKTAEYSQLPVVFVDVINTLIDTEGLNGAQSSLAILIGSFTFLALILVVTIVWVSWISRKNKLEQERYVREKAQYDFDVETAEAELAPIKQAFNDSRGDRLEEVRTKYKAITDQLMEQIDGLHGQIEAIPTEIAALNQHLTGLKRELEITEGQALLQGKAIRIPQLRSNRQALIYVINALYQERANSAGEAYNLYDADRKHGQLIQTNYEIIAELRVNNSLKIQHNQIAQTYHQEQVKIARERNRLLEQRHKDETKNEEERNRLYEQRNRILGNY